MPLYVTRIVRRFKATGTTVDLTRKMERRKLSRIAKIV